jgi:hypothetical protein
MCITLLKYKKFQARTQYIKKARLNTYRRDPAVSLEAKIESNKILLYQIDNVQSVLMLTWG